MKQRVRSAASLSATMLWLLLAPTAIADQNICQAIATEVNRRAASIDEQDLGSLSIALTDILPAGITRLESKDLSNDAFRHMFKCRDQEADNESDEECTNVDDETVQWMATSGESMSWYKHIVDTRPWNDLVVIYTHHSMHDREDALLLLRPSAGADLEILSSPFGNPEDMCCDRSFDLLRVGNQLKIVRPPSYQTFRDDEAYPPSQGGTGDDYDLQLDIYDDPTKQGQTGGNCSVHYTLTARLSIGNGSPNSKMAARLDRDVGAMARKFTSADAQGALRFGDETGFIDPRTPAQEIKRVRDFLYSDPIVANLTYDAIKVLTPSGAAPYYSEDRDADSRWFILSEGDTAYAALLMGQGGMMKFPFLALFRVRDGKLVLAATQNLKNVYRFSRAEAAGKIED